MRAARRGYADDVRTGGYAGERLFAGTAEIRYVLEPATTRPDVLVVGFAAAHEPDETPRYYTHRVLRELPCHRLFVLDDHGPRTPLARPSWYLGRHRSTDVPDSVCGLVRLIADELGVAPARVVTCGASKGGWAALYFGARCGAGHALAGEPQAFLGRYLMQPHTLALVEHVTGGTSPADEEYLDGLLFDAFRAAERPPHVHLYCGSRCGYLDHDVLPLARFLDDLGVPVDLELGDHAQHVPDLGRNFPRYLTRRLGRLLAGGL